MTIRPLRYLLPLLFSAVAGLGVGCEPTPSYIERYIDTEASEERFVGYIQDPGVSQEVRNRAMQLLFDQWQYSSSFFVQGAVITGIPESELRSRTLRDFLPYLRQKFEVDETSMQARDAAYHLREATTNTEVQGLYMDVLVEWVTEKWEPCRERAGVLGPSAILQATPAERVVPSLAERIRSGSIPDVECQRRALESGVEWVYANEELASAWIERWRASGGQMVENEQLNFTLFEHITLYRQQPAVRDWLFGLLADPETGSLFTNAVLDILGGDENDGDVDRYLTLLSAPRNIRWAAFDRVIQRAGSQGLRRALAAMPADADYSYYDGATQPEGFLLVARNVVCAIPRLDELRDNARQQFEDAVRNETGPARLLSLVCLERFGDARTVTNLTTLRDGLGPDPIPAPGFGNEVSVQDVFTQTIEQIQQRVAPPTP